MPGREARFPRSTSLKDDAGSNPVMTARITMGLLKIHLHKWNEVSRTFNYNKGGTTAKGSQDTVQKFLHGFTVIELKCETCGDLKHIEVLGKTV
jgi:hypothetical protein